MNKGKFTVKVQKSNILLTPLSGGNTQLITSSNKHYAKMRKAGQEKRIVNHTDSGRVTICADYTGAYNSIKTSSAPKKKFNVKDLTNDDLTDILVF